ncbi:hypothetical protein HAX54_020024 [Datura stramonium]|uniref:Uncharacterized protein n=1 Tax=Datura stramonium TaxID=4076 RepID=A0ABS8UQ65_DATST|nr:hypothetical protein [Datura stramonium]
MVKIMERMRSFGSRENKISTDYVRRSDDDQVNIRKGYIPVLVGNEDQEILEKVMLPMRLMKDPCIVTLLDMSAHELGYNQPGTLRIQCQRTLQENSTRHLQRKLQQGNLTTRSTPMSTLMEDKRLPMPIVARMSVEALEVVLMNYEGDDVQGYTEMVNAPEGMGLYKFKPKKLDIDLKNRVMLAIEDDSESPDEF